MDVRFDNQIGWVGGVRMKRIVMFIVLALLMALGDLRSSVARADSLDFASDDFVILDAISGQPIGNVHYAVTSSSSGHQTVTGLARYSDGTYDTERDEFDTTKQGELPVMFDYEHTFYKPGGAVFLLSKADFHAGDAACTSYPNGERHVLRETLPFPPSTYAGAALMLPMRQALRHNANQPFVLYDLVCVPGPDLVKVEALPEPSATWNHYPGDLVRTAIKPDFGIFSFAVNLFVPEMYAWFNPSSGYSFVGGKFARYYKGPEIILARKAAAPSAIGSDGKR